MMRFQCKTLGLTKTDDLKPGHYKTLGQMITYTITSTNTGTVTLHAVTVSDDPALTGLACKVDGVAATLPVADLAPGKAIVCTGTHAITQADLDAATFTDTAHTSATDVPQVNKADTIRGDQTKALALTKTDDAPSHHYDHVGQVVTYTLTATNNSNITVHNVVITDT